jgi:hypothetical protein
MMMQPLPQPTGMLRRMAPPVPNMLTQRPPAPGLMLGGKPPMMQAPQQAAGFYPQRPGFGGGMQGGMPQGMMQQIMAMMQKQQQPQVGAATQEDAQTAQYDAQLQAGNTGTGERGGNIFAGQPGFFSGMFDTAKRLSPFSMFYAPDAQAKAWL